MTFAENFSGVEDIKDSQAEVDKILKITGAVQAGALVIIIFLIIVSVVVVSNTVKLTVLARGREISIMSMWGDKLVYPRAFPGRRHYHRNDRSGDIFRADLAAVLLSVKCP